MRQPRATQLKSLCRLTVLNPSLLYRIKPPPINSPTTAPAPPAMLTPAFALVRYLRCTISDGIAYVNGWAPKLQPAMTWPAMAMFMLLARPVTKLPTKPSVPAATTKILRPHKSEACEVMGPRTAVHVVIAALSQMALPESPTTAATLRLKAALPTTLDSCQQENLWEGASAHFISSVKLSTLMAKSTSHVLRWMCGL